MKSELKLYQLENGLWEVGLAVEGRKIEPLHAWSTDRDSSVKTALGIMGMFQRARIVETFTDLKSQRSCVVIEIVKNINEFHYITMHLLDQNGNLILFRTLVWCILPEPNPKLPDAVIGDPMAIAREYLESFQAITFDLAQVAPDNSAATAELTDATDGGSHQDYVPDQPDQPDLTIEIGAVTEVKESEPLYVIHSLANPGSDPDLATILDHPLYFRKWSFDQKEYVFVSPPVTMDTIKDFLAARGIQKVTIDSLDKMTDVFNKKQGVTISEDFTVFRYE